MYDIIVLKEGYTKPINKGLMKSGGSVTLLKGPQNIIVDTGSPGTEICCWKGIPYEIDDFVEIWPTPGHTGADVSVIVRGTKMGVVAITGDLFECMEDLEDPELWQSSSEQPGQQEQSRIEVLRIADYIVPGHGPMFQVPADYRKQMRVVMMREERFMECSGPDGASAAVVSESQCVIVETD